MKISKQISKQISCETERRKCILLVFVRLICNDFLGCVEKFNLPDLPRATYPPQKYGQKLPAYSPLPSLNKALWNPYFCGGTVGAGVYTVGWPARICTCKSWDLDNETSTRCSLPPAMSPTNSQSTSRKTLEKKHMPTADGMSYIQWFI